MTASLEVARATFAALLTGIAADSRILVFHDSDADGVTAGVVLQLALQRFGLRDVVRAPANRERDAWSPANRAVIADAAADVVFVLDLGSREEPLADRGRFCFIDHHRPDGAPPGAILITAYTWDPIPNTSLIVFDLCSPLVEIQDLDWIAAVGAFSDLGERAPFPLIEEVRKRHTASDLKEVTALVNAARRASRYEPETAARALLHHRSPREFVRSESAEVRELRLARQEVQREMAIAKKAAPKFAGDVALIRVRSKCQVHPVVAQIWRSRLPKYIVVVANDGYLPGRVNFSVRAAGGVNLLDFLRQFDLGEGEGSYARGHDQATGGSLPLDRWTRLLEMMGFSRELASGMVAARESENERSS